MHTLMKIKTFFDKTTSTLTHVVYDETTRDAVIIDPVLDYDAASVAISHESIHTLMSFIKEQSLKVHYILETHAHADHISGAHELVTKHLPHAKTAMGLRIQEVQKVFAKVFHFPETFKTDGSQFHHLFQDNETVNAGSLKFKVLFTPGHTPACVSYLFGDAVFTGDALFMPDSGTGRCDFPDGDARALFCSIKEKIYQLPDSTRIFVGHDYQPGGRALQFETTVGISKRDNLQLKASTTEDEFIQFRTTRDLTLTAPKLLYPSIQINIAAGEFPQPESNGQVYLKLPVTFGQAR